MEDGLIHKHMRVLGLIPTRLGSTRLPQKPLLKINNIPMVIQTYNRAKKSKKLDDLYICCDDKKIFNEAKKYKAKCLMTSVHHANGTERIAEAYFKIKKKFDYVIDIQGDEPFISPSHIDRVIEFHKKNHKYDIILPVLKSKLLNKPNLIKVLTNLKKEVIYLSRAQIPYEYKKKNSFFKKHLSIISFKPEALKKFASSKKTPLESVEDIELLRAIELGLSIKTVMLKGDSFSIDVMEDYLKATNFKI